MDMKVAILYLKNNIFMKCCFIGSHYHQITFERNFQSIGSSSKSVVLNCNRGSIQLCVGADDFGDSFTCSHGGFGGVDFGGHGDVGVGGGG